MPSSKLGLIAIGSNVMLGKAGPRVKTDTGSIEFRNNADSAYAVIRAASPLGLDDVVTLRYMKSKGDVIVTGQIDGGAPPAASSLGRIFICTTTGGTYTVNYLYLDTGSAWTEIGPHEGQSMVVTDALTGGAVEFAADAAYLWDEDGTVWVNIGPASVSDSKHTLQRTVGVAYTDSGVINIGTPVSANGRVLHAVVNVTQAFNGVAPTLVVGDAGGTDRHLTEAEIDLTVTGLYVADLSHLYSVSTQMTATLVPDTSTAGVANITLLYAEA